MDTITQDLRYALRQLRARPGFTLAAVLALALGIGANTAMFSVVNAVLVQPLPFTDPGRLVVLYEANAAQGIEQGDLAADNVDDWRRDVRSLDGIVTWIVWGLTLRAESGEPEEVVTVRASPNLFDVLGAMPERGRVFLPEEGQPGRERVVVASHAFWVERLGADPRAVGGTLVLDDEPHTVVGIMPASFRFPDRDDVDLWKPLVYFPFETRTRNQRMFNGLARLDPGVPIDQARAELATVATRLADEYPNTNGGWTAVALPAKDVVTGGARGALLILLGAVGCVLLIACANVGNLFLSRGAERQRELAVRTALGAGRGRLVRQLLTESALLAIAGAALGVLLALWGVDALMALEPGHLPGWNPVRLDGAVLGFAAGLVIVTAIVAGLAPALHATTDLGTPLKEGGKTTAGLGRRGLQQTLVVTQVALSLVLVAGAALLIKSLDRLHRVDPGFDPEGLLAVTIYLPDHRYPDDARQAAFFTSLLERVRQLPGVVSAGAVTTLPFSAVGIDHDMPVAVMNRLPPPGQESQADFRIASEHYFATMRIALVAGREFTARDRDDAPPVVIVNQAFVDRYFPGENPLDQRVRWGTSGPFAEVIGVVGPTRHRGLDAEPRPEIYVPYQQFNYGSMTLAIRAAGDPLVLAEPVKQAVYAIDAAQPISDIATMAELVRGSAAERRFNTIVLGAFAMLALGLAAIGLYGVLSYTVAQRTQEIGVRMALGARDGDVFRAVLGNGLRLALVGVVVGGIGALLFTRVLRTLLFQVSPTDPLVLVGVAALLVAVAALASGLPAHRAARVDPMVALRTE
ncbi:MAG: ABC transporter permease [Gemmatimonadales bacterium]